MRPFLIFENSLWKLENSNRKLRMENSLEITPIACHKKPLLVKHQTGGQTIIETYDILLFKEGDHFPVLMRFSILESHVIVGSYYGDGIERTELNQNFQ